MKYRLDYCPQRSVDILVLKQESATLDASLTPGSYLLICNVPEHFPCAQRRARQTSRTNLALPPLEAEDIR
jgi:hypothetical protein